MSEPTGPPPPYPPYQPAEPARPADPAPPAQGRRWPVIVLAVLVAVAIGVVAVVVPLRAGEEEGAAPRSEPTRGLDEVRVYRPRGGHVDGAIDYDRSPPVGGVHHDAWLDCGVYDEPVPEENVVHDLEHGTVWITYEPGLDAAAVDILADALPQNGILSPYDDLRAPVVVTVWGRQLDLTGADDPRLELFIEQFGDGATSPEPFASCAGGITPAQIDDLGTEV